MQDDGVSLVVRRAQHPADHLAGHMCEVGRGRLGPSPVRQVPSRVVLEFGDAISGISRVSGQAARSIG